MKVVRKRTLKLRHTRIATAPAVSVLASQAVLCSLSAQESCTRRTGRLATGSAADRAQGWWQPLRRDSHHLPHFCYPWNPHSPSGRCLGAVQCPGQLPARQEMWKCPQALSGLLEKQEPQVRERERGEGPSSRQ